MTVNTETAQKGEAGIKEATSLRAHVTGTLNAPTLAVWLLICMIAWVKGGQCSHNHLAFKCSAGAGIKQQKKRNKKNKTRNYDVEEGGRELWRIRAVTQGKKGLSKERLSGKVKT